MAVLTNGVKPSPRRILRVGIIGCGEIAQVAHIPTLGFLSSRFQITYLCDVSRQALAHCAGRVVGPTPKTTVDPEDLCRSDEVDVVIVANVDEYHAAHAVLALEHDKFVFVEKPMALNSRDANAIASAEKRSKGKAMIGYMRRYASAFIDAVAEIGDLNDIVYARVRDIIGPNSVFVSQSGTFPQRFSDYTQATTDELREKNTDIMTTALAEECGVPITPAVNRIWRILGGLGSHDLSAMREALGMPQKVVGSSFGPTFWSVLFQYDGFPVVYESGLDDIPRFDAHLEVYGKTKSVRVQWDSPYVKGLPTTMVITENKNGEYHERKIRKTYEDAYTLEMKELYEFVANSAPIKTTVEDAKQDLELFRMIVQSL